MAVEKIRLLQCLVCKTLEELPYYEGDPRNDDTLAYLISKHKFADGGEHIGELMVVDAKHWNSPSTKMAIENQIRERSGLTGFDKEFYATKDTFQADAHTCFNKHGRNPNCNEYKGSHKKLIPDTSVERKEVGAGKAVSNTYLCDFCPVKSMVQQAHFSKIGLYSN